MKTIFLFLLLLTIGGQLKAQETKDSTVITLTYIEEYEQWCSDSTHIKREYWKLIDTGNVLTDKYIKAIEYGSFTPTIEGFKNWINEFKTEKQ